MRLRTVCCRRQKGNPVNCLCICIGICIGTTGTVDAVCTVIIAAVLEFRVALYSTVLCCIAKISCAAARDGTTSEFVLDLERSKKHTREHPTNGLQYSMHST